MSRGLLLTTSIVCALALAVALPAAGVAGNAGYGPGGGGGGGNNPGSGGTGGGPNNGSGVGSEGIGGDADDTSFASADSDLVTVSEESSTLPLTGSNILLALAVGAAAIGAGFAMNLLARRSAGS